jgi:hypothetical protein
MRRTIAAALLIGIIASASVALAAVPSEFTVQGVLRGSDGTLQKGPTVNVIITFYDKQTAGNRLAEPYVQNDVQISNGLFSTTIQDPNVIAKLSGHSEVWMEVSAGNDRFPRQPVTPNIYALMCSSADVASSVAPTASITSSQISDLATIQKVLGTPSGGSAGTCPSGAAFSAIAANGTATCTSHIFSADTLNSHGTIGGGVRVDTSGIGGGIIIGQGIDPGTDAPNGEITFDGTGFAHAYLAYYPHLSNFHHELRLIGSGTQLDDTTVDFTTKGTVTASNFQSSSDARLKTNVRTLDNALDAVERVRGVRFNWKRDGLASIGVIAQEVEQIFPELVSTSFDGFKAVDYPKLAAVLIEATKALHAQTKALAAKVDQLAPSALQHTLGTPTGGSQGTCPNGAAFSSIAANGAVVCTSHVSTADTLTNGAIIGNARINAQGPWGLFVGVQADPGLGNPNGKITFDGTGYAHATLAYYPNSLTLALKGSELFFGDTPINLTTDGNVVAANFQSRSDARLKTNIRTLDKALEAIERLRGVRFNWKKDGVSSIGVIAQELERVLPELVTNSPDGYKTVDYAKLTAVLIESTKQLHAENKALATRLDRATAQNGSLMTRLQQLESTVERLAEATPRRRTRMAAR